MARELILYRRDHNEEKKNVYSEQKDFLYRKDNWRFFYVEYIYKGIPYGEKKFIKVFYKDETF